LPLEIVILSRMDRLHLPHLAALQKGDSSFLIKILSLEKEAAKI
jgi:hypothetical protein